MSNRDEPPGSAGSTFDRDFWDRRWADVLAAHPEVVVQREPNSWLTSAAAGLDPGRALDAGCGHGSEALWLAARGWRVTAVDFSAAALSFGRTTSEGLGPEIARRVEWVEADLAEWGPVAGAFDLVTSLYVHVSGSVQEMVQRLSVGVAPGGRLLLVGHCAVDSITGAETRAAGQVQITVDAAIASLAAETWDLSIAEARRRPDGNGDDALIWARRRI